VNRERFGLGIILGIAMLLVGSWMLYSAVALDRVPGLQYVEITRELPVYDKADAGWRPQYVDEAGETVPGEWVTPFDRPRPVWDDDIQRWRHPVPEGVTPVDTEQIEPRRTWKIQRPASYAQVDEDAVYLSLSRTFGLWFAAICTLFVFSFLYRDNPFYKFTEALVVGVSAAYGMVVGFWTMVMPNLIGKLLPQFVATHIIPEHAAQTNLWYLVVLILGIMLLWRLSPVGGWIARWPLAFIIGITAGFRLIAHLESDFAIQIQATIMPLVVTEGGAFDFWMSLRNLAIVLGVLACLTYFFFSIEHKGVVGKTARVGIWVLMITFGAGFAYTVMGRITLLTQRIEFLFDDWLRLTDWIGVIQLM